MKILLEKNEENMGLYDGEDNNEYKVIKITSWVSCGKYETSEVIVQSVKDPTLYFSIYRNRSGSYYDDYYYNIEIEDFITLVQVKPIEKIITEWVNV